ncbi:Contactin-associated protein-like 4 [Varanus komodoensis]|nr:Contactin-associated protein-like 4 [Varanus komodoensis]
MDAFSGNTNADSVVSYKLQHSIKARFLRFVPLDWNHNGRIGMRIEVYGCAYRSEVADFDGKSFLLYRFNPKSTTALKDIISLKFKTIQRDGILLHREGQNGDHITLTLANGKLSLLINIGDAKIYSADAQINITLGSLLDDQHWHSVLIEHFNNQVNFTVDKHTHHFHAKGEFNYLDLDYELSFGGIPVPAKSGILPWKNFHGCFENLYYNGVNIIDLAKRHKPQVNIKGNISFSCSEPPIIPVTFLNPNSYLALPGTSGQDDISINFQFRTWNNEGLLLSSKLYQTSGGLLMYLSDGKVKLSFYKPGKAQSDITAGAGLNNGQWHSISLSAKKNRVTLVIDNDASASSHASIPIQISSGDTYYFGGEIL